MTTDTTTEKALLLVKKAGLARSRDLEKAGVTRTQLTRLLARGLIERAGRGLYQLPGNPESDRLAFAAAAHRVPGGVLCLLSALRFHGLTTQNPHEVWMAIENKAWRSRAKNPPLQLIYLTGPALHEGVEVHEIEGVKVRVFCAAKTVADCFKFRNKIGIAIAVEALRDYRLVHPKGLDAVWRFAEINRMVRVLEPYLESLR